MKDKDKKIIVVNVNISNISDKDIPGYIDKIHGMVKSKFDDSIIVMTIPTTDPTIPMFEEVGVRHYCENNRLLSTYIISKEQYDSNPTKENKEIMDELFKDLKKSLNGE